MGLFDRRKRTDDLDDEEEVVKSSDIVTEAVRAKSVNSDTALAEAPPPPAKVAPHATTTPSVFSGNTQVSVTPYAGAKSGPPPTPSAQAVAAGPPPLQSQPVPAAPPSGFGIDEAIQLARQLPNRNIDLVMQVVKKTLEALNVDVPRIVDSAQKKEQAIEDRISGLKKEIDRFESQIASARKEIVQLEADHKEVNTLKERLVLAQKAESAEVERALPSPLPSHTPKATSAASPVPPPASTNTSALPSASGGAGPSPIAATANALPAKS